VVVGKAADDFFADRETGVLGQFRHQYFLMNLMGHFQKAALMLFSEWLVAAISQLEVQDVDSIKAFKREIRQLLASFLRFTERYWFHVVSAQVQARDLFRLLSRHLDTDQLYLDVSASIKDMNQYLDSDSLRRQANTVVRLTVVTTLGLIATVSTGFLGMNIFDEADNPVWIKLLILLVVFIPSTLLVNYAVANSKVLSDFLEALADKRLSWWDRTQVLLRIWRNPPPRAAKPASFRGQASLFAVKPVWAGAATAAAPNRQTGGDTRFPDGRCSQPSPDAARLSCSRRWGIAARCAAKPPGRWVRPGARAPLWRHVGQHASLRVQPGSCGSPPRPPAAASERRPASCPSARRALPRHGR